MTCQIVLSDKIDNKKKKRVLGGRGEIQPLHFLPHERHNSYRYIPKLKKDIVINKRLGTVDVT